MKLIARLVIMSVTPLLTAALWMDRQPSPKPYQSPVLTAPAGSVPVTGREAVSPASEPKNPQAANPASVERGRVLFTINCAMCHGQASAERGPIGKKLKPPAPALEQSLLRHRSDAHIYRAISLGFGRMPPFKDKLTQQERWDVIDFLRTRN